MMSSRRLECNNFLSSKMYIQDVLKTSSRRVCKTSFSRRLQENVLQSCLEEVLEDTKILHWRSLQDVFRTSSPRRSFARLVLFFQSLFLYPKNVQLAFLLKADVYFTLYFQKDVRSSKQLLYLQNNVQPWNYNTNRNNIQEKPLLYT